jgi:hypothetical protein
LCTHLYITFAAIFNFSPSSGLVCCNSLYTLHSHSLSVCR